MESRKKEQLQVTPYPTEEPEIGRRLWALQDTRRRTLRELKGVTADMIDRVPAENESSIGTLLYHIADIEADWLYVEVLERPIPAGVRALFPAPTRDEQERLVQVPGFTLDQHLARLETVRSRLLDANRQMDLADFRRARSLPQYDVTPEWVLHHLMQHEAEHRSQIGALRIRQKS